MIVFGILAYKGIKVYAHVGVEPLLQHVYLARYLREVKKHHLVFTLQVGRVLANPQAAEQFLKPVLLVTVIVITEHT